MGRGHAPGGHALKLTPKVSLLAVALACVPVGVLLGLFLPRYGAAVRETEQRRQFELAQAAGALVAHHVDRVGDDARSVGEAMKHVGGMRSEDVADGLVAVEAIMATRRSVAAVRIEIPSRAVSVVLAKEGSDRSDATPSTEEQRRRADDDARGITVELLDDRRALLIASVGAAKSGERVYVTAPLYLAPMREDLAALVAARGLDHGESLVVLDPGRRVVVALGSPPLATGADGSAIPIVRRHGAADPHQRFAIQEDDVEGSEPRAYSFVTVDRPGEDASSGWAIALGRPHAVAYERLYAIRRVLILLAGGTLAVSALLAALMARSWVRPLVALERRARNLGDRAFERITSPSLRSDEIGEVDRAIVRAAAQLEQAEQVLAEEVQKRTNLSRFISPEIVEAILDGRHRLELGGERRLVTVLFADIVAFTPLSESRSPEEVVKVLNDVFSVLTEVVFRHEGVVDKFVGDSIMALWGAPFEQPDHAARALAAATDMMRFLENTAEALKADLGLDLRLAIAVNSGEVVVGNIGSTRRMEYTAIGDAVNVAARLEAIARPNQVLVGERTAELAGPGFPLRELGRRRVAGRAAEIGVYELEVPQ